MTPKEFYQRTVGQSIDLDGNGVWCWDLLGKFCQMVNIPLGVVHCSLTGYVRDIWLLRSTSGILNYFDVVPVTALRDGDWVIWGGTQWGDTDYAMTPLSHVGMYYQGMCFNQTKDRGAYLLSLDFSKAWGAFRWKGWSSTVADMYSEVLFEDIPMCLYKAPAGYGLYLLSAGEDKLQDIKYMDDPKLQILCAVNGGYFQMSKEGQADPYGTHYGVEQSFNGVDLAPKKRGLWVLYDTINSGVDACRSDEYWYSGDEVHFAITPYSIVRHKGVVHTDMVSTDLGSKEFVTNMQTMVMRVDGTWVLCITKKPCLPSVMARFADYLNADEAMLMDSGGSTQMMAYTGGEYKPIVYTGRAIPNAFVIAKEKPAEEPADPAEDKGDEDMSEKDEVPAVPGMSNEMFDRLRYCAEFLLPALATLIITLGEIFGWDMAARIGAAVVAFSTFLGSVVIANRKSYAKRTGDGG